MAECFVEDHCRSSCEERLRVMERKSIIRVKTLMCQFKLEIIQLPSVSIINGWNEVKGKNLKEFNLNN